jgi:hypothetical protein
MLVFTHSNHDSRKVAARRHNIIPKSRRLFLSVVSDGDVRNLDGV